MTSTQGEIKIYANKYTFEFHTRNSVKLAYFLDLSLQRC